MDNQTIEFKIDAYSPQEMAERVEKVGVVKARLDFWTMFGLSILGFEHSIANMYFIPLGIILKTRTEVIEAAKQNILPKTLDLSNLTWYNFFVRNLIPVTLGNIIGGVALVGIVYWFIYLRKE